MRLKRVSCLKSVDDIVFCTVAEYHVNNIQFLCKNSGEALLVCTTGELIGSQEVCVYLKELGYEDFAFLGQFCAKIIT